MAMDHFHARTRRRPAVRSAPPTPGRRSALAVGGSERLDTRLVALGLAPSRTVAQRLIAAGAVAVDGTPCTKASRLVPPEAVITCQDEAQPRFVSRAGDKLAAALATVGWSVTGAVVLDVGQSTGGFTDCLLRQGAKRVVGIDVGHDQLAEPLRSQALCFAPGEQPTLADVSQWPILLWEGMNARTLKATDLGAAYPEGGFDWIVGDLSFISAPLVWPAVLPLAARHGRLLWLIKPQFELGPSALDKHGVVADLPRWVPLLQERITAALAALGWQVTAWFPSALTGGGVGHHTGNQEFFVAAIRHQPAEETDGALG